VSWRADDAQAARPWVGPVVRYSLLKEILVVLPIVLALVVLLALLFSSPDKPATTLRQWANADAKDFVHTAVTELNDTSETATYGPPYNAGAAKQGFWFIRPQEWFGVRQPITGPDLVIPPLSTQAGNDPALAKALETWNAAPRETQIAWANAYGKALAGATIAAGATIGVQAADAMGPMPQLMRSWLAAGRAGAVDAALVQHQNTFFVTDWTRPMLLLEDGAYFGNQGNALVLGGNQWGEMNEEGNWPGAWWLAPYSLWYNIPPGNTSANGDLVAFSFVLLIALLTIFLPFVPGLRGLPRHLRVYRLVWRDYYARYGTREEPKPGR
jgi:hypothetical protein